MTNILFTAVVAAGPYLSNPYLEALGQVESGNNDAKVGGAGEISRYQIMKFVWREHSTYSWVRSVEPEISVRVAYEIMIARIVRLHEKHKEPRWLYVAWNKPVYIRDSVVWNNLPTGLCKKAIRYENLVNDILKTREPDYGDSTTYNPPNRFAY